MAFKDLLVCVANDPACATRVDLAVWLAAAYEAHLTGLYVVSRPAVPGFVEIEFPKEMLELQTRRLREKAAEAEKLFHARAERGGVPSEWRAAPGNIHATTILHSRYADLTITGQGIDVGDAPEEFASLPEHLALSTGRPVLVVPRYGTFPTLGERVLVAWNASREATRAVNDALPILQRAGKATVVSINPEGEPLGRVPGADISLHLARHKVKAEVAPARVTDIEVGDAILSYAADVGADLIVMGAYGHSRLREMVLGGATRHLLQHMTVPVLMSH